VIYRRARVCVRRVASIAVCPASKSAFADAAALKNEHAPLATGTCPAVSNSISHLFSGCEIYKCALSFSRKISRYLIRGIRSDFLCFALMLRMGLLTGQSQQGRVHAAFDIAASNSLTFTPPVESGPAISNAISWSN